MSFKSMPIGTIVNVISVIIGSVIGILLKQFFDAGIQQIVFQAVGLGTILIGLRMMWKLPDGYLLIFIFSLIFGGIIGQLCHIDLFLVDLSEDLKRLVNNSDSTFTEGLITAFLLFCIGSMTIVGAMEEGISQKRELLYIKSMLDGFTSVALASTYGIGVAFSVIPMFIFQGGLTIMAGSLKKVFTEKVIDSLSAVGGVLIIGISINLLQLGKINLENLLPSLVIVIILASFLEKKQKFKVK